MSSASSSSSSSFEEERARMYAQLFDCSRNNNNSKHQQQEHDQILGFQNRQVLRGAQALKNAVDLKRRKNSSKKHKHAAAENDKEAEHDDHKIILAYTSNIVSSGLRECIAALIADGAVDAVVTTAGGIEEDLIKCLGPTLVGDFTLEGASLRDKGLNRIGNLLVPNNNYVLFESFFRAVLHQHLRNQTETNCAPEHCAPSDILKSSGEYLTKIEQLVEAHYAKKQLRSSSSSSSSAASTQRNESAEERQTPLSNSSVVDSVAATNTNDDGFSEHLGDIDLAILKQQLRYSVAYQAWKHDVPILCPAFTDGSMGDMTFFFNVSYPGLIVDPLLDCVKLENLLLSSNNNSSSSSCSCSVFSIGGGLPKHFAMRAAAHAAKSRRRHFTSAVLITTTAPLTDGSVSAGTYEDDVSQFDLNNNEEQHEDDEELKSESTTTTELIHVRVEATLCVPFMTAMALF